MPKLLAVILSFSLMQSASAGFISATGSLADPQFDFAAVEFTLSSAADVDIQSWGFGGGTNAAGNVIAAGGFDTMVWLFSGSGPTATYTGDFNDDGDCPPGTLNPTCGDSTLHVSALAAGVYTLVVTAFDNEPCAAGGCTGGPYTTIGDDFTGLGNGDPDSPYAVDIVSAGIVNAQPAPAPDALSLLLAGMLAWIASRPNRSKVGRA
jgi:hypothetical protein